METITQDYPLYIIQASYYENKKWLVENNFMEKKVNRMIILWQKNNLQKLHGWNKTPHPESKAKGLITLESENLHWYIVDLQMV